MNTYARFGGTNTWWLCWDVRVKGSQELKNPQISWNSLKIRIKEGYSELTDPFIAREKCRHLKQKKESVQNFAERTNVTASDLLTTFGFRMSNWNSWTYFSVASQMTDCLLILSGKKSKSGESSQVRRRRTKDGLDI